jgi:hypothetical protein
MTPKSFFNIVLKIFGLFFLHEIIKLITQLAFTITAFKKHSYIGSQVDSAVYTIIYITAFVILFYSFISFILIFKTNYIVDKLRLDSGFEQNEFLFNFSSSQVLTVSLIVIGGIILTEAIPAFCKNIFLFFQEKNLSHETMKPDYTYIIIDAVKIITGLLLLGERKRIVAFVQNKHSGNHEDAHLD